MVNYSAVKSSRVIKIQGRQDTENGIDFACVQAYFLSLEMNLLTTFYPGTTYFMCILKCPFL